MQAIPKAPSSPTSQPTNPTSSQGRLLKPCRCEAYNFPHRFGKKCEEVREAEMESQDADSYLDDERLRLAASNRERAQEMNR